MNRAANSGKKRATKSKEKEEKRAARKEQKGLQTEEKEDCKIKKGQPTRAYGLVNDRSL